MMVLRSPFAHARILSIDTAAVALDDMEQFSARMRRMCREERVEFFDIRNAWEDYMLRSYKPYDFFARDSIHGNSRGKQVVARILARYPTFTSTSKNWPRSR